jgi:demethylmenaquinone methyltransferase/2-methoxy-6-polyprenyl-1,4-benzoquinol methylase
MAELEGEAKQRYVADMFARIARRYDLMNTLMTAGMHRRWRQKTAQVATQGLVGKALDIATGTGDLALALARRPGVHFAVGIDFLPEMVALAQVKAHARGLAGKTSLIVGDALSLPFPDASFACATAGFSLRNMADLPKALAEMVRVVGPGGRVATLELTPLPTGARAALPRFYFHRLVPLLGQLIAGDRTAYTYLPQSVDRFLEAENLAELFRGLGLSGVGYLKMGFGMVALHWGNKPVVRVSDTGIPSLQTSTLPPGADNGPAVGALPNLPVSVVGFHPESQAVAFHLDQFSTGSDGSADVCRSQVLHIDLIAHRSLPFD